MATAYSCDRCGETIDEPTWFTTLRQEGVFPEWSLLCKSCADSFEEWLEGSDHIAELRDEASRWEKTARRLSAFENPDYLQPDEEVRE